MGELIAALVSGTVFSFGLILGDATNPARVIGFLDIFGDWDATLVFVMAGALVVAGVGQRLVAKQTRPLFAADFALPWRTAIDRPLVAGSALFGLGWGLAGFCPGPAFAIAPAWNTDALIFLASMIVGMAAHALLVANRATHDH